MKKILIFALCLLMAGCADEYAVTTVTTDEKPKNEVQLEVKEEAEIYDLSHFIPFEPEKVLQVSVSQFHYGPTVSEQEAVIEGWDAQEFARKLAALPVTDFDENNIGQGSVVTRYTLKMLDGSEVSFCDNVALYQDDSAVPAIPFRGEYLCCRTESSEIGYSLGQIFTWYDYIDGERLARHRPGALDGYIPGGIGPSDIVEVTVQEYMATSDSHGTFIEREYHLMGDELLKNDPAEAAAEILKNTTVYGPNAMTEQMGLASGTRYTLKYWHGFTQSFCVDKAVFLSDAEPAWYHVAQDSGDCELLCVLADSNYIELPIPEDTVITTYYHVDGQKLTEEEFYTLPTLSSLIEIQPENVASMEIHRFYKENEAVWKLEGADAVFAANSLANDIHIKNEISEEQNSLIFRYIINYKDGSQQSFCVGDTVFLDDSDYPSPESAEVLASVIYDTGVPIPYEIYPVDYTWMNGQRH